MPMRRRQRCRVPPCDLWRVGANGRAECHISWGLEGCASPLHWSGVFCPQLMGFGRTANEMKGSCRGAKLCAAPSRVGRQPHFAILAALRLVCTSPTPIPFPRRVLPNNDIRVSTHDH